MHPGDGFQGVVGGSWASALTQLSISDCMLPYDEDAEGVVAAALTQLPEGLQHLTISNVDAMDYRQGWWDARLPLCTLLPMQQLTFLELAGVNWEAHRPLPLDPRPLEPLEALTRLVDFCTPWSSGLFSCTCMGFGIVKEGGRQWVRWSCACQNTLKTIPLAQANIICQAQSPEAAAS
jgi:hypothetical protein